MSPDDNGGAADRHRNAEFVSGRFIICFDFLYLCPCGSNVFKYVSGTRVICTAVFIRSPDDSVIAIYRHRIAEIVIGSVTSMELLCFCCIPCSISVAFIYVSSSHISSPDDSGGATDRHRPAEICISSYISSGDFLDKCPIGSIVFKYVSGTTIVISVWAPDDSVIAIHRYRVAEPALRLIHSCIDLFRRRSPIGNIQHLIELTREIR